MQRIAENGEEDNKEDDLNEEEQEEPETETLKYANRSGSYALCSKAGIGKFKLILFSLYLLDFRKKIVFLSNEILHISCHVKKLTPWPNHFLN